MKNCVNVEEDMDLFERIKEDKIAVATSVLLMLAMLAKLLQAGILHIMTEYYPLTSDNILNTAMGLMPTIMLLAYVLVYNKTDKPQLLLPCTFVFQFAVTALYAWVDYQAYGEVSGGFIFENGIWLLYYGFLIYVTYKGFENINMIRWIMGIMIAYSIVSGVVTLITAITFFPEETVLITSQVIAMIGNICYYLATFLIVPKAVEEVE